MEGLPLIPLFPLGIVMLPHQLVPLHIFEERYKQMIGNCLAGGGVFGIVYFDGRKMHGAGCTARVEKVLERYPDGRMDILTRGEKRFVIGRIDETATYLQAEIDYFDDESEEPDSEMKGIARRGVEILFDLGRQDPTLPPLSLSDGLDVKRVSFEISGSEGFSAEEKQRFLEMRSTRERLRKSVAALSRIVERNRLTQEVHGIIGGNGHLPPNVKRRLAKL